MNDKNKTPEPRPESEATPLQEELGHEAVAGWGSLDSWPKQGAEDEAKEHAAAEDIRQQDAEEKADLDEHYEEVRRELEKKPEDRPQ